VPQPTTSASPPDASPLPIKPLNPAHDPRTIQPDLPREAIVIRQVVRVPVERPAAPVLAWVKEHSPPVQLLTAWVIVAVLIMVCWLGS
jgi:hypothetical protein